MFGDMRAAGAQLVPLAEVIASISPVLDLAYGESDLACMQNSASPQVQSVCLFGAASGTSHQPDAAMIQQCNQSMMLPIDHECKHKNLIAPDRGVEFRCNDDSCMF